jgi:hypothetical protein
LKTGALKGLRFESRPLRFITGERANFFSLSLGENPTAKLKGRLGGADGVLAGRRVLAQGRGLRLVCRVNIVWAGGR